MFSRLLNALLGWLSKPSIAKAEVDPASAKEEPDHWQSVRKGTPPGHWLEAVRNAGAPMRGGSEDAGESLQPSSEATESRFETKATGKNERANQWYTTAQKHHTARRGAHFDMANTALVPRTVFPVKQAQESEAVRWAPAATRQSSGAVVRFLGWLAGSPSRKPAPISDEASAARPKPSSARILKFEAPPQRNQVHERKWEPSQGRERAVLLTFPSPKDLRAKVRKPAYASVGRDAAAANMQWKQEVERPANWVGFDRGNSTASEAVARVAPAFVHDTSALPENPSLASWPELPVPHLPEAAALREAEIAVPKAEGRFENACNVWPELPLAAAENGFNWRSLMRSVVRSQRLEREQRGY